MLLFLPGLVSGRNTASDQSPIDAESHRERDVRVPSRQGVP